jgi:holo-[acyl-carrier protein] synthase
MTASCEHPSAGGVRVGVDVVAVERIAATRQRRPEVLARLFSPGEIDHAERGADPAATLAGAWAAKEAWAKAAGRRLRAVGPCSVELVHLGCGAPHLEVGGEAVSGLVSVSHDGGVAVAVVALSGVEDR